MLSPVEDHILQEINTLHLTRFRVYKIARPPQAKTLGGEGPHRQINTCHKVPLLVNFLDDDFCIAFYQSNLSTVNDIRQILLL